MNITIYPVGIVITVVLILFLIILGLNVFSKKRKPILSNEVSKYFIIAYIGVLILSVPVLYALPDKSRVKHAKVQSLSQERPDILSNQFDILAKEGKLDGHEGIYKNFSINYKCNVKQLYIEKVNESDFYDIWIERKKENDGKVEAISYITPFILDNIDITEDILPPKIELSGNKLIINRGRQYKINRINFNNDFVVEQFTDYSLVNEFVYEVYGRQAIFLNIPKDMEVTGSNLSINYVD